MLYPIGIQSFEKVREGGYAYVDKSDLVYRLATTGQYYFLSRPRRFGKSLLVSTLEAYFQGRKDLFEGLAIAKLEKEWLEYPVFHLDLSGASYTSEQAIDSKLNAFLDKYEQVYSAPNEEPVASVRFSALIEAAFRKTGRQVVILIDEYDKPVIDNLGDNLLLDVFRKRLQGFYSVLKSMDRCIKFGFLTGVTKIGKLSVFSGLNNLKDISMDARYSAICGISEKELKEFFPKSVMELADAKGISIDECYARLARMYDGYHFCENSEGMYNPFSLLNTFDSLEFRKYWYATGTPSFLVEYLVSGSYTLDEVASYRASELMLSGVNASKPNVITLLYQTGYLTIKDYDAVDERYILGYPNKEVEDGFVEALSLYFTPIWENESTLSVDKFVADIRSGNADMLMRRFTAFFADMDYQIQGKAELYFQNTMYVMLKLMGQQVQVERHTSNGRIDVLIQTDKYVYILELKRDQDPNDALDQIEAKGYEWPFLADGRKVFKIGASFSTSTRRLEKWVISE